MAWQAAHPSFVRMAWLLPLVGQTASHDPKAAELRRALVKYADELHVDSLHRYALRPEVVSRGPDRFRDVAVGQRRGDPHRVAMRTGTRE